MELTRDFKQTIIERARRDPEFAKALRGEASALVVSGEPDAAHVIACALRQSSKAAPSK